MIIDHNAWRGHKGREGGGHPRDSRDRRGQVQTMAYGLRIGLPEVGVVLSWCRTVRIESFVHLPKCTSIHGYR